MKALWIEINLDRKKNIICGILYRQHNSPDTFQSYFDEAAEKYTLYDKPVYIMGDFNIDLLKSQSSNISQIFLLSLQSLHLIPTIDKPTRVHNNSATLIDDIFTSDLEYFLVSGNIVSDLTDHFSQYDVQNNLAPDHIRQLFKHVSDVHSYNTRSATTNRFYVQDAVTC